MQSYEKTWNAFQLFVTGILEEIVTIPVTLLQVEKYVAHLWLLGYAPSTIATALSALSFVHEVRDVADPTAAYIVKRLLKAVRKQAVPSASREPITQQVLLRLLVVLENRQLET